MSRADYDDGCDDNWAQICWRGAVASATRGARGQALFAELLEALDAMPVKRLIAHDLEKDGEFCTLGVVGHKRGIPLATIDPYDYGAVSRSFNVAQALAREIEWMNDEAGPWSGETPEKRWTRMREWVSQQIRK